MTRDEIIKMPAGKELDALIAEKVLGYQKLSFPAMPKYQRPSENGIQALYDLPDYSTKIHAAWEVLEKMESLGFAWELATDLNSVWCEFANVHDHTKYINANGNSSAPFAICRAALLAIAD